VFHDAAVVSVPQSIEDPELVNNVNVNGTLVLLRAALDSSVKRFVYASSCAVYGEAGNLPIAENHGTRPLSPYGVSKLAAENYVRVFHEVFGLETVCLRFFNVYGPRQTFGPYGGVITQFINRLSRDLPPVILGRGGQTRDFVHVRDVVQASLLALKGTSMKGETFNVATGVPTTIRGLARTMLRITGKTHLKPVHAEDRKGDISSSIADISKTRRKLGYEPMISLEGGLRELLQQTNPRAAH